MSELGLRTPPYVGASPQDNRQSAEKPRKPARKTLPSRFPNRITFCAPDDQVAAIEQIKRAFRCTEAFAIRMCIDTFCRTNDFPLNIGGADGVLAEHAVEGRMGIRQMAPRFLRRVGAVTSFASSAARAHDARVYN